MGERESLTQDDVLPASAVHRIAAMLDVVDAVPRAGDALPRGWHFPLLAARTPVRDLRVDGFPGLGVPMPDLSLPRLLLAGRTLAFDGDIAIGAGVERTAAVDELKQKDDAHGRRAIVTLSHRIGERNARAPAIVETQTYLLLPAGAYAPAPPAPSMPVETEAIRIVTPSSTMLFQFSALGFNSHRIHLDREYARGVEGYPDLVVNGGLTTLLLTEFARRDLGLTIRTARLRYLAPLFADRQVRLVALRRDGGWQLQAHDDAGTLAVEAELEVA